MPAVFAPSALLFLLLASSPAAASSLYQASVIVTGMDMRSRPDGLTQALRQVLTKVSGNPAWLDDDRLNGVAPAPLLASLAYIDRQSDIPKHDEQGTRDRPYYLVARFDPDAVTGLLHRWGDAPWTGQRPVLDVHIDVTTRTGDAFPLRADTDSDERHRGALLAAADRFGVDLFIPAVTASPPQPSHTPVLTGTLAWSDSDNGWNGSWRLEWNGTEHRWGTRGQAFDNAYRDALAGACRILSGH